MSSAMLIISLVSAPLSFISFLVGRRKPTKGGQRILYTISVILCVTAIVSGVLSYTASVDIDDQLELTRDQASEASAKADKAQAQITEIKTPRRIDLETKRMLAARLKPYAGQKYDMKVYRDQDSLELAASIQIILEEAGWEYTNVYPKRATQHYAETRGDGAFIISGKVETRKASEAGKALLGALNDAGLYDDSAALTPMNCA